MTNEKLVIDYKIFREADEVAQSRSLSSEGYLKNSLAASKNPYIARAEIDNESDLDDFTLRLYVEEHIEEEKCEDADAAEAFLDEMANLLAEIAHIHSFLDMEGSFSIDFEGEHIAYTFTSEAGSRLCDFTEQTS